MVQMARRSDYRTTLYLIGLAIGIALDDDFLIELCSHEVNNIMGSNSIDPRAAIGELESIVIFMKAASSKNRAANKLESLFEAGNKLSLLKS